ncbi:hypothetical protein [Georgenia thermotolerans]|uniref:Uncharacterized protein n=1 Tax=Georgenia thermotolerans TaxID=527326 RepID=A0A7J5UQV8_9MICO|nr:hypothetical protein [Georgenia thermotolerans]KAE8764707.1 hypothetical protein GB883_07390 [Georgenia thermotolerans]
MSADPTPAPCIPGPCQSYRPGHSVHFIQARLAHRDTEGWADGIVCQARPDGTAVVDYLDGGSVTLWHHGDLTARAPQGSPVRVHERYRLLACGRALTCVLVLAHDERH